MKDAMEGSALSALGMRSRLLIESELSLVQRFAHLHQSPIALTVRRLRMELDLASPLRLSANPCTLARLALAPLTVPEELVVPHVRQCPICTEAGYHAAVMQLKLVSRCPVHGAELLDGCISCGAPIEGYVCRQCKQYCCGAPVDVCLDDSEAIAIDLSMSRELEHMRGFLDYVEGWLPESLHAQDSMRKHRLDLLPELVARAASHFWQGSSTRPRSYLRNFTTEPVLAVDVYSRRPPKGRLEADSARSMKSYLATVSDVEAAVPQSVREAVARIVSDGLLDRQYWLYCPHLSRDAVAIALWRMILEGACSSRLLAREYVPNCPPLEPPIVKLLRQVSLNCHRRYLLVLLCSIREHLERRAFGPRIAFDELATIAIPSAWKPASRKTVFLVLRDQFPGIADLFAIPAKSSLASPEVGGIGEIQRKAMQQLWRSDPRRAFQAWLDEPGATGHKLHASTATGSATRRTYSALFAQYLRFLCDRNTSVVDVTPGMIDEFVGTLTSRGGRGSPSQATVDRVVMVLERVYMNIRSLSLRSTNPVEVVTARRGFRPPSRATTVLSDEEYRRLIFYVEDLPRLTLKTFRQAALLAVAIGCGIIGNELRHVRLAQVSVGQSRVAIAMPENGTRAEGDIEVPPWSAAILLQWLAFLKEERSSSVLLFPSGLGSDIPLSLQTLQRYTVQALASVGRASDRTGSMRVFRATQASMQILDGKAEEVKTTLRLRTNKMIWRYGRNIADGVAKQLTRTAANPE